MKRFKYILSFLFIAVLSIAMYYFFETDIQTFFGYTKNIAPKLNLNPFQNSVDAPPVTVTATQPTVTNTTVITPPAPPVIVTAPPVVVITPPPVIMPPISEQTNGVAIFNFTEKRNGQDYPDKPTGNGYILVHCPSHSRVATPTYDTPQGANSFCEYSLKNQNGEIVLYVKDTIGGFHPNFFDGNERAGRGNAYFAWVDEWAKNFKPFGIFNNYLDRANNHFDQYQRYLLEGHYTFTYRNLSSVKQQVTAGYIRASNGTGDVNEIVAANGMIEKAIHIFPPSDEYDSYKINTNNNSL